jgi:hypothetical protein
VFNNISGIISQQFAVPGSTLSASVTSLFTGDYGFPRLITNGQPTDELIKHLGAREETFFVYAKIEYTDVRSGQKHFTHACVQYNPTTIGTAAGFFGCEVYNEGN